MFAFQADLDTLHQGLLHFRIRDYTNDAEMMLSKPSSIKKGCYTCQWLDNVDIHLYAKFEQNIPCGSRVMSIFTN